MTTLLMISRQSGVNQDLVKNWYSLSVMPTAGGLWRVDAIDLPGVSPGKSHKKHCYVGVGMQWVDIRDDGGEDKVSELVIAKLNCLVSIFAPCMVGQRAVA